MFDLSNLNDYEFEILCRDIMSEILSMKLYTFPRGIDGGIDICDKNEPHKIVIQVKHYVNSSYSQLKSSLKNEIPKVKKINPKKYYVCTSKSLTLKNRKEILNLFSGYMRDISFILDGNIINTFLERPESKDIIFKNYKLWLSATNVLNIINNQNVFIDCAELMIDIQNKVNIFVETNAYNVALDRLSKDNVIIITGAPGVGKSTISKMVLLYYISKGYDVRYVTNNDIVDIKKTISQDLNKKEVIFFDDFLGQHYMNLKDSLPNELKSLISFIEKSKHKKVIMNSRITILNEAIRKSISLKEFIENHENNKYLLDLKEMSKYEKAKILYNHLYFCGLPKEHFTCIKKNKNYFKIIEHKNYNPRIIEYVTSKYNYDQINANNYMDYIMNKLTNPEDVWDDEFRNRIESEDRILMNTLYSLTNGMINSHILEEAFNNRIICGITRDTSINQYKNVMCRLTSSLLKRIENEGDINISVINPSVNDYLRESIANNIPEQIKIINNAVYFEQILKVIMSERAKQHFIGKIYNDDLLKMKTLKNSSYFYFIKCLVNYEICDKRLNRIVGLAVEKSYINLHFSLQREYGSLIKSLITSKYYKYYGLEKIFLVTNRLANIIKQLRLKDISFIVEFLNNNYNLEEKEDLLEAFHDTLVEKIIDRVSDMASDDLYDSTSRIIEKACSSDIEDFINDSSDYLENMVVDEIEDTIYDLINDEISDINEIVDLDLNDFDISDISYSLDISGSLESALSEREYEYDYIRKDSEDTSNSKIVEMFER
ncbi:MAG: hypothetical protein M0P77_04690 [Firmicutes bacterium]|nr:hypothetical protein [Bacillota bacterium]